MITTSDIFKLFLVFGVSLTLISPSWCITGYEYAYTLLGQAFLEMPASCCVKTAFISGRDFKKQLYVKKLHLILDFSLSLQLQKLLYTHLIWYFILICDMYDKAQEKNMLTCALLLLNCGIAQSELISCTEFLSEVQIRSQWSSDSINRLSKGMPIQPLLLTDWLDAAYPRARR